MRWFSKVERREIWDQPIEGPIGDIEAAHRIREICRAAADSADKVRGFADGPAVSKQMSDIQKRETERYERAVRAAMETAMTISDDLLRDAAVRQIVELCLAAKGVKTARILFRAIQAPSIRDDLLQQHPALTGE